MTTFAQTGDAKASDNLKEQVSFVITHHVHPENHPKYEEWLHKTILEAAKYPGHLGTHVAKPTDDGEQYEISVRFATRADAERWINSDRRHELVKEIETIISEPERLDIRSGIDYWFTTVTEGHKPPKRWKQWLTSVSVIWPLTMIIPLILRPLFRAIPILGHFGVVQLIVAMCVVFMVVYVVMPPYTRAIAKWLSR